MGKVLSFALTLIVLKMFFPELTDLVSEFIARVFEIMLSGLDAIDETFSSLPIR